MVNISLPVKDEKRRTHYRSVGLDYRIFSIYMFFDNRLQFKMQENYVELANSKYKIYSTEKDNVIYEIDLNKKDNEKISLIFYTKNPQKIGGIFDVKKDESTEILLKDLVAACSEGGKEGLICSFKDEKSYNEVSVDITLNGSIVSVKSQITSKECDAEQDKSEREDYLRRWSYKSWLRTIEFKGMFAFDVDKYDIRDLLLDLQKCNIDYTIEVSERWIIGHMIDVPCIEVKTKYFMIVCNTSFLEAHFSKDILKHTYCTNHLGERFNMHERMINAFVKGARRNLNLGVDNVWREYHENSEYPVSLGYNV